MGLESLGNKKINLKLLKKLSSLHSAQMLICKFEKHYGKIPAEQDFYNAYLKYSECESLHGKIFNSSGGVMTQARNYLNPAYPIFWRIQFKLLENYLASQGIIKIEEQ